MSGRENLTKSQFRKVLVSQPPDIPCLVSTFGMLDKPSDSTEVAWLSLDEVVVLVEDGCRSKISIRKKTQGAEPTTSTKERLSGCRYKGSKNLTMTVFPTMSLLPDSTFASTICET